MLRKLAVCFLALVLLLVLLPADRAQAAYSNGFFYSVSSGWAYINDYWFDRQNLTVPSTIEGFPVWGVELSGVTTLINVKLSEGIREISDGGFAGCNSLRSITLPKSLTAIGFRGFAGCTSLASIDIPPNVSEINSTAFIDIRNLVNLNVSSKNPYFASIDGTMYSKDLATLIYCPPGKTGTLTVPSHVTSIADRAFMFCDKLTAINLPGGLQTLGGSAFTGCSSLTSISIPAGISALSEGCFASCNSLATVNLPEGMTTIGKSAFSGCKSLASIKLPGSVTTLENDAFFSSGLSSIQLPAGLMTIAPRAFWGSNLTSLTIPGSVAMFDLTAIENCDSLTTLKLSEGAQGITNSGYSTVSLTSLRELYLPRSFTRDSAMSPRYASELIVYGYGGTFAESYANKIRRQFVDLSALQQRLPGDANDDGEVSILDLVSVIDYIVSGIQPLSPANADANEDSSIDILDLVWIIDDIVGA